MNGREPPHIEGPDWVWQVVVVAVGVVVAAAVVIFVVGI